MFNFGNVIDNCVYFNVDVFEGGVHLDRQSEDDNHVANWCLVAIGRLQVTSTPNSSELIDLNSNSEFITRQTTDGKITFVDQRVLSLLGYNPSELLGKNCFDFYHLEDRSHMHETFEQSMYSFLF